MNDTTAIVLAVLGSTGLWGLIQTLILNHNSRKANKADEHNIFRKAHLAALHEMLYKLCDEVIEQGYVTQDQLERIDYMKEPYFALNGDGTLEHMLNIISSYEVKKR